MKLNVVYFSQENVRSEFWMELNSLNMLASELQKRLARLIGQEVNQIRIVDKDGNLISGDIPLKIFKLGLEPTLYVGHLKSGFKRISKNLMLVFCAGVLFGISYYAVAKFTRKNLIHLKEIPGALKEAK